MKQFIKQKLNLLLEAFEHSKPRDYYKILFTVAKIKQLYGGDEYFENASAGDFIGSAIVGITGRVTIRTNLAPANFVKNHQLGLMGENRHYLTFQVMAGRGIEHSNTDSPRTHDAITRNGIDGNGPQENTFTLPLPQGVTLEDGSTTINIAIPKPGSPASDAQIKTYLIYGQEIIDFVQRNLKNTVGYKDGKSADISKEKMEPKQASHKMKKDLETELGRRISDAEWNAYQQNGTAPKGKDTLTADPNKLADFEKRQNDAKERIAKAKLRMNK